MVGVRQVFVCPTSGLADGKQHTSNWYDIIGACARTHVVGVEGKNMFVCRVVPFRVESAALYSPPPRPCRVQSSGTWMRTLPSMVCGPWAVLQSCTQYWVTLPQRPRHRRCTMQYVGARTTPHQPCTSLMCRLLVCLSSSHVVWLCGQAVKAFNAVFWDAAHASFLDWIDVAGNERRYFYVDIAFTAVVAGVANASQAGAVLAAYEARLAQV